MSEEYGNKNKLTEHMVFMKTRANSLADVTSLNMWGFDLNDVSIVEKMINLEQCSLSKNHISSLKCFSNCRNLQKLFLRENDIHSFEELGYLAHLNNLHTLWLADNPIANVSNYRQRVFQMLPQIEVLDDVTQQEADRNISSASRNRRQVPIKPTFEDVEPHQRVAPPEKAYVRPVNTPLGKAETACLTAILALIPKLSDNSIESVLEKIRVVSARR